MEKLAKDFDELKCSEQLKMISDVLFCAWEREDFKAVECILIPLSIVRNRILLMEEKE